jgi:AraC-like DNA-binding protein
MLTITQRLTKKKLFNAYNDISYFNDRLSYNFINDQNEVMALTVDKFQTEDFLVFIPNLKYQTASPLTLCTDQSALMMIFVLSGKLEIQSSNGVVQRFIKQLSHFTLFPEKKQQFDIIVKGDAKLLLVCLTGDILKKSFLAAEVVALRGNPENGWPTDRQITSQMIQVINAVVQCTESNLPHQIFLTAKVLELLFLNLEQIHKVTDTKISPVIRPNDLVKLELAKTLIKDNLKLPYSLIELAHKVGLNDFKLKKGFRSAFGTTVFGYLFDMRMAKAKNMLSTLNYSVGEVANEVGYKNAHHFSAAFKKKFGYLPSKRNSTRYTDVFNK